MWPSTLLLLKRTRNLQLSSWSSHKKCNTHAHIQTPTQLIPFQFKADHSSPPVPLLLLHYKHVLLLCSQLQNVLYLVYNVSQRTLNLTQCLPWTFAPTNLSIKSRTPPPTHTSHEPHQEGADLVHSRYHYHLGDAVVIVRKNGAHLLVCRLCFIARQHFVPYVEHIVQMKEPPMSKPPLPKKQDSVSDSVLFVFLLLCLLFGLLKVTWIYVLEMAFDKGKNRFTQTVHTPSKETDVNV